MTGKKVIFDGQIYKVIFDYENGKIEISKESRYCREIKLVEKDEVKLIRTNG